MHTFLILQAGYQNYEVGLFNEEGCIDQNTHNKKYASKNLIPTIHSLLKKNNLSIQNITAIGTNQGPGPFTSIRIILSTVNGIAFGTAIPLYGFNSLEMLLQEHHDPQWPTTIALLNACNNDAYYALQQPNQSTEIGCQASKELLENLEKRFSSKSLRLLGNGTLLMQSIVNAQWHIPEPLPLETSLEQIAQATMQAYYDNKPSTQQLLPLYLKNIAYTTAKLS